MSAVLRFIAWAATQIWRYGSRAVNAVIAWARANWRTVLRWLERGVSFGTIFHWILQQLGLA
jgi:hypothetical protein